MWNEKRVSVRGMNGRVRAGVVCAILAVAGTVGLAGGAAMQPPVENMSVQDADGKVSIFFQGGPVQEYAGLLEDAGLNVIVNGEAREVRLTDIKLRGAQREVAAKAAEWAVGRDSKGVQLRVEEVDAGTWTISAVKEVKVTTESSATLVLRDLIEGEGEGKLTMESVLSAIDAGVQTHFGEPSEVQRLRLRYHPETTMLFVAGPSDLVQVAREIFQELKNDVVVRRAKAMRQEKIRQYLQIAEKNALNLRIQCQSELEKTAQERIRLLEDSKSNPSSSKEIGLGMLKIQNEEAFAALRRANIALERAMEMRQMYESLGEDAALMLRRMSPDDGGSHAAPAKAESYPEVFEYPIRDLDAARKEGGNDSKK